MITSLDGPSSVHVHEVAPPVPETDEVLIEVHAAGVAFPEVLQSRGLYQLKPDLPFIPGAEVAGIVRACPDHSGLEVGDRVAALPLLGGFAEQVRSEERRVGKECVSTCRSRRAPAHKKKK